MVVLEESGDLLGVDGLRTEPKELLGVDEVPKRSLSAIIVASRALALLKITGKHTWGSCCPCARADHPRRARPPSLLPQPQGRQQRSRRQVSRSPPWGLLSLLGKRRISFAGQDKTSGRVFIDVPVAGAAVSSALVSVAGVVSVAAVVAGVSSLGTSTGFCSSAIVSVLDDESGR